MKLLIIVVIVNLIFKMLKGKARGNKKNIIGSFLSKFAFMLVAYFAFVALHTF